MFAATFDSIWVVFTSVQISLSLPSIDLSYFNNESYNFFPNVKLQTFKYTENCFAFSKSPLGINTISFMEQNILFIY